MSDSDPIHSDTVVHFADLDLNPQVLKTLNQIGYEQPTPIQAETIPHLLQGEDLLGTAQTGTGKTAAFALPLLTKLDFKLKSPQVLVLTPTRELAIQVSEAFQTYARSIKGFHVLPIYGGQSMQTQLQQLRRGVQVVVGTPGRVMDHLRRKSLKLDELQTVVLDEADEMLRMGFIDDVTWILDHTPENRQVALFSATMPGPIRKVANQYLKQPKVVKIEAATSTVEKIEQSYWIIGGTNKLDALTRILEVEEYDGIIIFVRTKTQSVDLAQKLEARGHSAAAINGDMTQNIRERTIDQLKRSKLDILVATDVAARGIDVPRISHVINYDIPYDTEAYVHRIGRTGRAGRTGKAILFVAPRERRLLNAIEKATRQPMQALTLPSREQILDKRVDQFKNTLSETLQRDDLVPFQEFVQEYLSENEVEFEKLAAGLLYLAQADKPLFKSPSSKPEKSESSRERRDRGDGESRSPGDRQSRRREPKPRKPKENDFPTVTYRLEVGNNQGARPADIVGAIANEAGIEARYIGRIELFDDHSTVDLPTGMPKEIFNHLQKVRVRNQPLKLSRAGKQEGASKPAKSKSRSTAQPRKRPAKKRD